MSKAFTPIVISRDVTAEKEFRTDVERKYRLSKEFFSYVDRFVKTEDRNVLKHELPYNYFIEQFTAKFEGNFPPQLSVRKQMELLEVDTAKIDFLSNEIASIKVEIDFNTGLPEDETDFNIYTQSEDQNRLYKYLTSVADAVAKAEQFGITTYPANICGGFNGWLGFDFNTNKIVPNISRVLGNERNF
jgi:hypothetical protein